MRLLRFVIILFISEIVLIKPVSVVSQNIEKDSIRIEVVDRKEVLPGVVVRVKDTNPPVGAVTDINGQAVIEISERDKVLILSFIGPYTECEIYRPVDTIKVDLGNGMASYYYLGKRLKKRRLKMEGY